MKFALENGKKRNIPSQYTKNGRVINILNINLAICYKLCGGGQKFL